MDVSAEITETISTTDEIIIDTRCINDDLRDENAFLRSELTRLYAELGAQTSGSSCRKDCVTTSSDRTEEKAERVCSLCQLSEESFAKLEGQVLEQKSHISSLITQLGAAQRDIAYHEAHSAERAEAMKSLEEQLKLAEDRAHMMHGEVLQILPLRLKVNELKQRIDDLNACQQESKNELFLVSAERTRLKATLDSTAQHLEQSLAQEKELKSKIEYIERGYKGK
jgi:chromosome segregation ATPase